MPQLLDEVKSLFGCQAKRLFKDPEGSHEVRDVSGLEGKTVYTSSGSNVR